jgi:hypothetical protein
VSSGVIMDPRPVLACLRRTVDGGQIIANDEKRRALARFESCRTAALGCRIMLCGHCETTVVLYNACNHRGCPKCYQKNQIQWVSKARSRVLATSHHHLVFSIPESYTEKWLREPRAVIRQLFDAVAQVMKSYSARVGLRLAWLQIFQSHGRGMSYKPHIHCVLADGGLDVSNQWKRLGVLPLGLMTREFAQRFCEVDGLFEPVEPSGWKVHASWHEGSAARVIGYLGQTMAGVVTPIENGLRIDDQAEVVEFEDLHGRCPKPTTLKQKTFVERYLAHIPPDRTVTVRYYGLYANRHREDLEVARGQLETESREGQSGEDEYQEVCPCCRQPMHVIMVAEAGKVVDFSKYGYTQGPPKHGEYRRLTRT